MGQDISHEHPAPARGRVGQARLLAMLACGPASWAAQLLLGYGLSSYACYPADTPRTQAPPPGWGFETPLLLVINLACLCLALLGAAAAAADWRRSRDEKAGDRHQMLEIGEGRTRFLAMSALLSGVLFAGAIVFNTLVILRAPTCWDVLR